MKESWGLINSYQTFTNNKERTNYLLAIQETISLISLDNLAIM